MIPDGNSDPVEQDAKIIADAAVDLGQARQVEIADDAKDGALAIEEQRIAAERATLAADKVAQHGREERDEQTIANANADAQRRTSGAPGPNPPPQPPRPRVG